MNARAALFGVFILFALLVGTALLWPKSASLPFGQGDMHAARIENGVFFDPRTNFAFAVPNDEWRVVDLTRVRMPKTIESGYFALRSTTGSCTILHARTPSESLAIPPLKQISFGDRVFNSAGTQFDSSWWVYADEAPAGIEFQGGQRTPLPGEMRITQHPDNTDADHAYWRPFILYNEEGGTVSEDCDRRFTGILETLRWQFEQADLARDSAGSLYIKQEYRQPARLLFRDDDGFVREIMRLSSSFGYINPIVYRNRLLTIKENEVYALDPFSQQTARVASISAPSGEQIIALHMADERVFILTAPSGGCLDMGRCASSLYVGQFDSGSARKVASDLQASWILGYDREERAVYFRSGYGDAGCFSATISRFDIESSLYEHVDEFGGCAGEPEYDDAEAALKSYTDRFEPQAQRVNHVRVESGQLRSPGETSIPDGSAYPLTFVP